MNPSPENATQTLPTALLALLVTVLAALLALAQWQFFTLFHPHLPVRDTFRLLELVELVFDNGILNVPLADWLLPHAGAHRIALTRVLMVLDYQYLGGRNHLLFASTAFSLGLLALLYLRAARELAGGMGWATLLYLATAFAFLASPSLFWNLVSPVNASWYCALAFSAAALWLLLNREGTGFRALLLALGCAVLAALSNFAGVVSWVLLPLALALRGSAWARWCAALALGMIYLFLPELGGNLRLPDSPATFLELLRQVGTYLGSPLGRSYPELAVGLAAGSVLLLLYAWLAEVQRANRDEAPASRAALWTLLLATLCLGIAMATLLGRVVFVQPDALRYQCVVMLYWLNIALLLPRYIRPVPVAGLGIVLLVVVLLILPLQQPLPKEWSLARAALQSEARAQGGGVDAADYGPLLPIYARDLFESHRAFLEQHGLALFHPGGRRADDCALQLWQAMRPTGPDGYRLVQELLTGPCSPPGDSGD